MQAGKPLLPRLEALGRFLEDAVLAAILTAMIVLAAGQILLRNLFDIGFIWSDELLRMLVLWVAVAGAVAASRSDRHINIAVLDRWLPDRLAVPLALLIHLFTAAICALVTGYSFRFVATSKEFADVLLGNVPAWWLQSVLPLGFALITWRYLVFAAGDLRQMFTSGSTQESEP